MKPNRFDMARRSRTAVLLLALGALLSGSVRPAPPDARLRNLHKGLVLFLSADYVKAEAALRTHLTASKEKYGLAAFLLGACLTARSFTEAEKSAELLEEGTRRFREAKRWGAFRLPDDLKTLISPRILNVYYRAGTR
ncbi:MAG: hypothetical protein KA419_05525 [Acidobacteria bacterium]|nr:hypothetical protein [Acidobacteriota bacterium]